MKRRTPARASAHHLAFWQRRPEIRAALFFCLALVAGACGGGSSHPAGTAVPSPAATAGPASSDQPARRDLVDLARRLGGAGELPRSVQLPPLALGDVQTFQLVDLPDNPGQGPAVRPISATVRAVSEHAYFLFENGGSDVDDASLQSAVQAFESTVWPKVTGTFGLPAIPGVDGDPRIFVLDADLGPSIGGYVNGDDAYPQPVTPNGNGREMIYLNSRQRPVGDTGYQHLVAHELQHLIHQAHGGGGDVWLNEGLSEYSGDLLSGPTTRDSLMSDPDVQLNGWDDAGDHYGASALFVDYLVDQTGSDAGKLASAPGFGSDPVREYLRQAGSRRTFEQMAADWAIANLLDEPQGPYSYLNADVGPVETQNITTAGGDAVHQFGADYLELDAGTFASPVTFEFQADATVPVIGGQRDANGAFWWSGRGDDIDSSMTRELDLSDVQTATLTFRTWFEMEKTFDYGYIGVSRDNGATWAVLPGNLTSTENPLGAAYGPGYTGSSAGWQNERIDLTPFAGSKILLRFELVNDDGTNLTGWAIDDIAVPETGFSDDGSGGGWQRQGFRSVAEELPQRFALRLVTYGETTVVQDITLSGQNAATIDLSGLGSSYQRAVLVVMGLTDGTTETASYQYDVKTIAPTGTPGGT